MERVTVCKMVEHGLTWFSNIYQRVPMYGISTGSVKLFASLVRSISDPGNQCIPAYGREKGDPESMICLMVNRGNGINEDLRRHGTVPRLMALCFEVGRSGIDLTDEEKEFLKYGEEVVGQLAPYDRYAERTDL